MTEAACCWTSRSRPAGSLALVLGLAGVAVVGPGPAAAQDELDGVCATAAGSAECRLAAASARTIQPRVGLALWGGNPVPGTASTVGLRRRAVPRLGFTGRLLVVPATLPPLLDRSRTGSSTGIITATSVESTVGIAQGLSPLPTVGGVFSLDAVGRVSLGRLPTGKGFDRAGVWAVAVGLRLGLLRESLTLPGLSITAVYGRSTSFVFGDPSGLTTDGSVDGRVSGLSATAAASRRVFGLRLGGGVSWDRYGSDPVLRYSVSPSGPRNRATADAVMERWSGFASVTWTRLIYHVVVEVGRQESPTYAGLPPGVELDPWRWWGSVSFRVTP